MDMYGLLLCDVGIIVVQRGVHQGAEDGASVEQLSIMNHTLGFEGLKMLHLFMKSIKL